jgi:HAD superfamily hydrolase (TIGR01458 family)
VIAGGSAGWLPGLRGVLMDVDGTLWESGRAVEGAAAALARLREAGIALRLTTNTTRRPRTAIAAALRAAGLQVEASEILVPASIAARLIAASGRPRAGLLVPDSCAEDLEGVESVEEAPDWVVVGDLGRGFTFDRLNRGYHWLRGGASLIALHRGRIWITDQGEVELDAGPFVAALEYAAATSAELVGKPAKAFFDLALAEIGLPAHEVIVVGDDGENDIEGGAAAGTKTALVRTGKQRGGAAALPAVTPDLVLASVADLDPRRI